MAILGAGNMGTALAAVLAGMGHEVTVWDAFPEVVEDIARRRENRRFLPGISLPETVRATHAPADCAAGAALVALCVPSSFTRRTLSAALPSLQPGAVLLNVAKGFAPGTRSPLPFLLEELAPGHPCVHLAGPALADEFVRGRPAAVVFAGRAESAARRVADWFAGPAMATSHTTDVTGAVLGGILKNVYAILLGALAELAGGSRNLEAAALTAALREMTAIATAQGAMADTLHGLAGLGDLAATGFSPSSHNRELGRRLAAGADAAGLAREHGWLPEGARAAAAACELAAAGGVPAPLAGWVHRVVAGAPPSLENLRQALREAVAVSWTAGRTGPSA